MRAYTVVANHLEDFEMTILLNLNPRSGFTVDLEDLFQYFMRQGKTTKEIVKLLAIYVENGCTVLLEDENADKLTWELSAAMLRNIWSLKLREFHKPEEGWTGLKCVYASGWCDAGESESLRRVFHYGDHWELIIHRKNGVVEQPDPVKHVLRKVEHDGDQWLQVETVPGCSRCTTWVFNTPALGTRVHCMSCGYSWDIV